MNKRAPVDESQVYEDDEKKVQFDYKHIAIQDGPIIHDLEIEQPKVEVLTVVCLKRRVSNLNLLAFLILALATILYENIIEECTLATETSCIQEFLKPRASRLVLLAVSSSALFTLLFILAVKKKISRLYILAEVVILFYLLIYSDHIVTGRIYKGIYQLGEFIFLTLFLSLYGCIEGISKLLRKYRMKFVISIGLFLVLTSIYSNIKMNESCDNWKKGIAGKQLSTSEDYCEMVQPEVCWYDIFHGKFDASKVYDCTLDKPGIQPAWIENLKNNLKIPKGTNYIELPRIEYVSKLYQFIQIKLLPQERSIGQSEFQKYFFTRLNYLTDLAQLSEQTETYLDLKEMKYITKLVKNESLALQRLTKVNTLQKKIKDRKLPQNIIVLYVDAVARARFIAKMPKTVNWFEQQAILRNKQTNFLQNNFPAFRYLSVGFYTYPNYLAYEYGIATDLGQNNLTAPWATTTSYQNVSYDNESHPILTDGKVSKSFTKDLHNAGYMVAKARSLCSHSIMEHSPEFKEFIELAPPDHEYAGVLCDPNFQNPENPFGMFKGAYGMLKRCLYGKEAHQYVFDYGKQFLQAYSDQPKYLELEFLEGHEGTGDAINNFDEPMSKFLEWLEDNKLYKDSIIYLVSDHGLHMQGLYYLMGVQQYSIEVALPGLFFIADKSILMQKHEQKYRNFYSIYISLEKNEQVVVTFFEMHYMMKYFITEDESSQQQYYQDNSLLSGVIDARRGCRDIPLYWNSFCVCKRRTKS